MSLRSLSRQDQYALRHQAARQAQVYERLHAHGGSRVGSGLHIAMDASALSSGCIVPQI